MEHAVRAGRIVDPTWKTALVAAGMVLISPMDSAGSQPPLGEETRIYILAGQSNMSGRGSLDDLAAAERETNPRILAYGNDGILKPAQEPIDSSLGQIDGVSADRLAAVGPGLFFARTMKQSVKGPIVLVPCAKGGSSISRWKPGGGRDTLYGSCLARTREVQGRLSGILWYQGESDTEREASAEHYGQAFKALVDAFRRDLGAEGLPVVFAQIAEQPMRPENAARYPAWEAIRRAQASLSIDCAEMVPVGALPRQADELHLTTAAQRQLGGMMTEAMWRLQNNGCQGKRQKTRSHRTSQSRVLTQGGF